LLRSDYVIRDRRTSGPWNKYDTTNTNKKCHVPYAHLLMRVERLDTKDTGDVLTPTTVAYSTALIIRGGSVPSPN